MLCVVVRFITTTRALILVCHVSGAFDEYAAPSGEKRSIFRQDFFLDLIFAPVESPTPSAEDKSGVEIPEDKAETATTVADADETGEKAVDARQEDAGKGVSESENSAAARRESLRVVCPDSFRRESNGVWQLLTLFLAPFPIIRGTVLV